MVPQSVSFVVFVPFRGATRSGQDITTKTCKHTRFSNKETSTERRKKTLTNAIRFFIAPRSVGQARKMLVSLQFIALIAVELYSGPAASLVRVLNSISWSRKIRAIYYYKHVKHLVRKHRLNEGRGTDDCTLALHHSAFYWVNKISACAPLIHSTPRN